MVFYDLATESILGAYGAIVWTLWCRITMFREAKWFVRCRIPEKIFLLKSEPEIIVVIFNQRATIRRVRRSIRTEHFIHYKKCVFARRVRENSHGFQQA